MVKERVLMAELRARVDGPDEAERKRGRRVLPVIPPNFFGISFGLAGLAEVWVLASPTLGVTDVVGRVLGLIATSVWVTLLVIYLSKGTAGVHEDWRNPILSPFMALVVIVPTLLAGMLCGVALSGGRVLVVVLSSLTIAVGGGLREASAHLHGARFDGQLRVVTNGWGIRRRSLAGHRSRRAIPCT
jgi:hypothetical protein